MANHLSTQKSIRKIHRRSVVNKNRKSRIKTFIKKVEKAASDGLAEEARSALINAQSEIMKGVSINVIKKNTAARRVSRLYRIVSGCFRDTKNKTSPSS